MCLAFIISAYKNLDQLERLVRRLENGQSTVVVHVDKKTSKREYAALRESVQDVPSLRFLDRHVCHYGGFGHVRATLKGIDELLQAGIPFEHAILLTGQDYPIKPLVDIHGFFASNRGRSFMSYTNLPSPWWSPRGGLDRVEYRHLRLYGRHLRLPGRRNFPTGLKPFGGGAYWCLASECVALVSEFVARRPDVVRFFEHVDVPDEIYFQTVVLNSELAETVVNDNLRYIDWSRGRRPAILGVEDLEQLRRSPKLFARKFDVTRDEAVLDLIDRELVGAEAISAPARRE